MKQILKIQPLLFGLSLFAFTWMIALEVRSASELERLGFTISGVDYDSVFFSALLVLAAATLLLGRLWSLLVAAVLSGAVSADVLFRDFWLLAKAAEVPVFSYRHFSLWWPNLGEGQLLQMILSGAIFVLSVGALIRRARSRGNRTMSNNGMHPTPHQRASHES
jgi:hypothetical protein